jgi:hypothetical protein
MTVEGEPGGEKGQVGREALIRPPAPLRRRLTANSPCDEKLVRRRRTPGFCLIQPCSSIAPQSLTKSHGAAHDLSDNNDPTNMKTNKQ